MTAGTATKLKTQIFVLEESQKDTEQTASHKVLMTSCYSSMRPTDSPPLLGISKLGT